MNVIPLSALIGFIFLMIMNFFPSKRSLVEKYKKMEQRELTHISLFAKNQIKLFLAVAFFSPIPFGFIVSRISSQSTKEILISFMILVIFSSISAFSQYRKMAEIVESELQYRKDQRPINKDS